LGEDYVIHFRQRDAANLNAAAFRADPKSS